MTILVSACLLGTACRYDGRSKADAAVAALLARPTLSVGSPPRAPRQSGAARAS